MAESARSVAHHRRRALRAVESFKAVAESVGPLVSGQTVFCLTRGQWGAVDLVNYVISELGPCHVALWTWALASYELSVMESLLQRGDILTGRLVVDQSADKRNPEYIEAWRQRFGESQVRITRTHCKLYRVWNDRARVLAHGSFNLNYSVRCENCCVEVDSPAFDLVAEVEDTFPVLPRNYSSAECMAAGQLDRAYPPELLAQFVNPGAGPFQELKPWQP
jgi:hypothetical protein